MVSFARIVFAVVGVCVVGASATCQSLPPRTGVGRDTGGAYDDKEDWCPSQIEKCGFICGGSPARNNCYLYSNVKACYECTCADGSSPPLELYSGTIPSKACEQSRDNCWSAPGGGIMNQCDTRLPKCGEIYLTQPLGSTPAPTTSPIFSPLSSVISLTTETAPAKTITVMPTQTILTPEAALAPTETSSFVSLTSSSLSSLSTPSISSSSISTSTSTSVSSTISSGSSTSSSASTTTTAVPLTTTSTKTSTSLRTTSSSATVTTTFRQAAAAMTSIPWVEAAIGVVGLVMVGL